MEAIKKQATKLREQVAKQQQAVFKQFASGLGGQDNSVTDEVELQQHQKLEKLYISTRAGKHFQRDIVRGVEGYIISGSKQIEIGTRLAEDSRKYGAENTCTSGNTLSKAALSYSRAQAEIEKEREDLLKALGTQAIEVSRRQAKLRESNGNPESASKLEAAEAKLKDLKSNMATLGKEAFAAMTAVEAQQQRLTLQRLVAMVEAQRHYHQRVLQILDQLEAEMMSERQRIEASPSYNPMPPPPAYTEVNGGLASQSYDGSIDGKTYFLAEVVHPYEAESAVELTLSVGDYVVVRKVSNNGWAEGECKGNAGWFPFGYVERRERILATKVAEVF
ncbi:SH3 domain-containing protein 2-like isoform X2 [Nicotiana tabacum]|uniref:SH3 domain-containing protein 2-like isoform X2 n=2 Tax=Nicotiana tabacum TaxID=4097 RepID=A0AC58RYL3_TOBAC|nr:PREDICTED: SH3 domain-containing protein 2-like isoform X2 [Nicotiana tabacum]